MKTLGSQWQQLDASDQEKWLTVAARYPKLEAEEQQRLQARMAQWAQMSPAQRTQVRIGWQDAQRVKPQERQAKWERYQALTEEQREALKLRASQRPARLIVPAAGQSLPPLMAQARAGVSTITPGSRSAPSPLHPLPLSRLDPQTLLPKSGTPHKQ
ncbi:DNA-binding CsgD family transcriptional regulator [Inhella inkyongensis]|uniref:DNA-binding CsgD family transcriptional regulator n=1 Tax=Inhella inkyongensis TaxID=392593 RepID=A0A840RYC1_9BURK|nr:DNA-binding CsgD family transcriptional regulator [Inhella inkyongensis]